MLFPVYPGRTICCMQAISGNHTLSLFSARGSVRIRVILRDRVRLRGGNYHNFYLTYNSANMNVTAIPDQFLIFLCQLVRRLRSVDEARFRPDCQSVDGYGRICRSGDRRPQICWLVHIHVGLWHPCLHTGNWSVAICWLRRPRHAAQCPPL